MVLKNLYDLVWKKPLNQICKEQNIAYTAFKQLFIDNKIPLPQMGHWTKLRFGKPVYKTPLPKEIDAYKEVAINALKKVNKKF